MIICMANELWRKRLGSVMKNWFKMCVELPGTAWKTQTRCLFSMWAVLFASSVI